MVCWVSELCERIEVLFFENYSWYIVKFYVYILRCSDGSLYVGQTTDIEKRLYTHNAGKGSTYTANRRPVKLLYKENQLNKNDALKRETQLKKMDPGKKTGAYRRKDWKINRAIQIQSHP